VSFSAFPRRSRSAMTSSAAGCPRAAPAEPSPEQLSRTITSEETPSRSRSAATASRQATSSSRCAVLTMQKETSGATAGLASCRIGARDPPEPRILLDLEPVRVHVVDPSAYTPPYDRALCAALARRPGLDVTLVTSPFRHGEVPPAVGFAVDERFYRRLPRRGPDAVRLAAKLARHPADMLRYRARGADLVHFQWLTVQHLDRFLLPRGRPRVLTAHDVLPREPRPGQRGPSGACTARWTPSWCTPSTARSGCARSSGCRPSASTSSRTGRSRT
jgi:hypothetical protein